MDLHIMRYHLHPCASVRRSFPRSKLPNTSRSTDICDPLRFGAGLESGGSHVTTGNNIMMVGIVTQVITLAIFGLLATDIFIRIRKFRGDLDLSTRTLQHSRRFKGLLAAITLAYSTIFIRC